VFRLPAVLALWFDVLAEVPTAVLFAPTSPFASHPPASAPYPKYALPPAWAGVGSLADGWGSGPDTVDILASKPLDVLPLGPTSVWCALAAFIAL
jgi:hypothetical protein